MASPRHLFAKSGPSSRCPEAPFRETFEWIVLADTIAVILLILWLLGFVSGYTIGAFIHVLLVIALVLLLVQFVSGRRVV